MLFESPMEELYQLSARSYLWFVSQVTVQYTGKLPIFKTAIMDFVIINLNYGIISTVNVSQLLLYKTNKRKRNPSLIGRCAFMNSFSSSRPPPSEQPGSSSLVGSNSPYRRDMVGRLAWFRTRSIQCLTS